MVMFLNMLMLWYLKSVIESMLLS